MSNLPEFGEYLSEGPTPSSERIEYEYSYGASSDDTQMSDIFFLI